MRKHTRMRIVIELNITWHHHNSFNPISFSFTLLSAINAIIFLFCFLLCAFCVTNDARTCALEKFRLILKSAKDKVSSLDGNMCFFKWMRSISVDTLDFKPDYHSVHKLLVHKKCSFNIICVRILRKRKNAS